MSREIRIKLEKFVGGQEQRIFKTKTGFLNNLIPLNRYLNFYFDESSTGEQTETFIGRTDIFHAEYNTEKLSIANRK